MFALTLIHGAVPYESITDNEEAEIVVTSQFQSLAEEVLASAPNADHAPVAELADHIKSMWYTKQLDLFTCYSALFSTDKGSFGMGALDVQNGDALYILFGARTPFLLRPEGDHWILLGDAYCYDLMDVSRSSYGLVRSTTC